MKIFLKSFLLAIISLSISSLSYSQINDSIPLHQTFTIESKNVGESRVINVWTPEEYKSGNDSLPVLYMPDGGTKEDFPHIANTLAELIKSKKIKPVILVGIENTQRRRDLTGPTEIEKDKEIAIIVGKSANFRSFITEELIPEINRKYRTSAKKGIIGESLAGLFVFETFLLEPKDFNFYIAFDPSLWWNNFNYEKNVAKYLKNLPESKTKIWFASSGDAGINEASQNITNALEKILPKKLIWKYSNEPNEKHNTLFRACKENALVWALNEN
ncbi:MAG: alpha/beta hydrolase-fold protein [Ferruginibacter sp.]